MTAPSPKEAVAIQKRLVEDVRSAPLPSPKSGLLVAGADCSYRKKGVNGYAALVVCRWPDFDVVEIGRGVREVAFPYVPGLLSFRELPLLQEAWEDLSVKPDLVVVDGHGRAHPRRLGLATHAGLVWDCPTLGCGKTRLVGEHREPGPNRGNRAVLVDRGERVGTVLRTRDRVKPVYVSPGHRADIESSADWILRLAIRYRLPEVIRLAHREVNRMRREAGD